MVAVRSNKEMELTPALTPIAPYKSQTGRCKRGIILRCMNDPHRRVTWQATSNDENS